MTKTYLVTGATGFIGSHLVRQLCEDGHHVRVLTRQATLPAHVADLTELDIELVQGDLLEPDSFAAALDGLDGLFHLAGYISTDAKEYDKVYALNYTATHNLFEQLQRKNVGKIVFLASIFALNGGTEEVANEDSPYLIEGNPVGYFQAKRKAELEIRALAEAGMPIVFTYPNFCLGPGDALLSSSRLLLMYLKKQVPAYFPGGWNVMDVRDAARALILSMEKGTPNRRYLVGGVNQSFKEFFDVAYETLGIRKPMLKIPAAMATTMGTASGALMPSMGLDKQAAWIAQRHWYYDDSRARQELGHTSRPLSQTLIDAARWFVANGQATMPPKLR